MGAVFAVAVVLALSSAAFACTVWKGRLTVWGVSPGSSGSVSAVGSGGGGYISGMTHCSGSPSGQADVGPANGATRQIMLSVAAAPCAGGGGDGKLPPGIHLVNYLPDKSADCMNGVQMGQFIVDGNGAATPSEVYTIPGLGSDPSGGLRSTDIGGWADICVDSVGKIFGNQVPIFLLGGSAASLDPATGISVVPSEPRAGEDFFIRVTDLDVGTVPKPKWRVKISPLGTSDELCELEEAAGGGIDIGPHDDAYVQSDSTGVLEAEVSLPRSIPLGQATVCITEIEEDRPPVPTLRPRQPRKQKVEVRTGYQCQAIGSGGLWEEFPYGEVELQGCERHHIPAKGAYSGNPRYRQECGPVVIMESADHRLTGSHGVIRGSSTYRRDQRTLIELTPTSDEGFRQALRMDVHDLFQIFGAKYMPGATEAEAAMDSRMQACLLRRGPKLA